MKLLLFSLLVVASFSSCKKEDSNQLSEPSSSGKNFMACKVNGVVHRYTVEDGLGRNGVGYIRFAGKIQVGAGDADYKDDVAVTISLPPDSVESGVTYELGGETSRNVGQYFKFQKGGGVPPLEYFTTSGSGWIRFSRVDTLVGSGTFAFTAYIDGQQGKDSIVITEGVFDIAAE